MLFQNIFIGILKGIYTTTIYLQTFIQNYTVNYTNIGLRIIQCCVKTECAAALFSNEQRKFDVVLFTIFPNPVLFGPFHLRQLNRSGCDGWFWHSFPSSSLHSFHSGYLEPANIVTSYMDDALSQSSIQWTAEQL